MTTPASTATTGRAVDPEPFTAIQATTPILVDIFPALVTLPELPPDSEAAALDLATNISRTRVIITGDPANPTTPNHLYVFTDSAVGPAIVYSAPTDTRTGTNREGTVATPEGTVSFTKETGCGCGSALKSFAPFTHPYSAA